MKQSLIIIFLIICVFFLNQLYTNNTNNIIQISKRVDFLNEYTVDIGSEIHKITPIFKQVYVDKIDFYIEIENSDQNKFIINNKVYFNAYNKTYYFKTPGEYYDYFNLFIETNGISNLNYKCMVYYKTIPDWFEIILFIILSIILILQACCCFFY